ncbi:MAG TPA: helix-turn-helix domain-containing protein [Verrucomicrobiae bacterium]|nr:helix-turn-helix domain-containing protein [Verrucomicrobiae bacterium]
MNTSEMNVARDSQTGAAQPDLLTLRNCRARAERDAIRQALERTGWIRKRAARLLAISYRSLLYKIERYKIEPDGPARARGGAAETASRQG